MKLRWELIALSIVAAGCARPAEKSAAPVSSTLAPAPYANLAQVMRGVPFPASNIIFDTQSKDPAAPLPEAGSSAGATATFAGVYGGWQQVENSALVLSETANLLLVPGRLCENGRPAPIDREDYVRFSKGLVDAGKASYEAAKSRDLDAMVEVSGTVSDACAQCHEVYRDKDDPKDRCVP